MVYECCWILCKGAVLVRFARRNVRDRVHLKRFSLKCKNVGSYQVFINEDLSNYNQQIYAVLRQKQKEKKIHSVWSCRCRIYCRVVAGVESIPIATLTQAHSIGEF